MSDSSWGCKKSYTIDHTCTDIKIQIYTIKRYLYYINVHIYIYIKSPGEEHGNPLQDSCLENPMDRRLQSVELQRVRHE